ncbi:DUF397 domain-containing protein [Streptomyces sp. NPDC006367]|uniref:DUF397 domain-containing protein n=1 Tax=unclassified Streptomyces TaxID=2593676 RepID=UPI0033A79F89
MTTDAANKGIELTGLHWRSSSYSNGSGGDCVEVAHGLPGLVPVRDSKQAGNGDDGPVLLFRPRAWQAFVDEYRVG